MPVADTRPIEPNAVPRRRRLRPQISLRALLLLLTLFAIGFPIWYTWPYWRRIPQYPIVAGKPDPTKPPTSEMATQMKRVFGGEPIKHGKSIIVSGPYERTSTYDDDVLHGEYVEKLNGKVVLTGRYERGKKQGEWRLERGNGVVRQQWHDGKLHGPLLVEKSNETEHEFVYDHGVLIERDGKSVSFPLFEKMARGEFVSDPGATALDDNTQLEFVLVPLKDVVLYLCDFHETAIYIHPSVYEAKQNNDELLVTSSLRGVNLATALAVVADDLGLTCDYRYGGPWITTRQDATDWVDATGVMAIDLPENSPLARQWEVPLVAEAIEQPLDVLIHNLLRPLGVPCDTSAVQSLDPAEPQRLVSINERRQPLKNLLGLILTRAGCRCELRGQTLFFLPHAAVKEWDAASVGDATKK